MIVSFCLWQQFHTISLDYILFHSISLFISCKAVNTTTGNLMELANRAFPLEAQLLQRFCDSLGVTQNDSLQASKLSQNCWFFQGLKGSPWKRVWRSTSLDTMHILWHWHHGNNMEQWWTMANWPSHAPWSSWAALPLVMDFPSNLTQEVLKLTTLSDLIKLLVLNLLVTAGTRKRIMSDHIRSCQIVIHTKSWFIVLVCTGTVCTMVPVVPRKAVAEVSKIGHYRRGELLWCMDGRANPLMDRRVVGVVFFGMVAMVAVVTSPTTAGCSVL